MANYETWTPYVALYQNRGDGYEQIGNTMTTLESSDYGTKKIMGLSSVSIKYGMGYILVDVAMPIHQKIVEAAQLNEDNEMSIMFDINNYWKIEFGWSHSTYGGFVISQMRLVDWSLDYDANMRLFNVRLSLQPANTFILSDIKVMMLDNAMTSIKRDLTQWNPNDNSSKEDGHPLSLGVVISKILNGAMEALDQKAAYSLMLDSINVKMVSADQAAAANSQILPPVAQPRYYDYGDSNMNWIINQNTYVIYPSDSFMAATREDIPKPEEITILLFGTDKTKLDNIAKAFFTESMESDVTLKKLTDINNKDMSCLQFISDLLDDNGFSLMPSFASVNGNGKLQWIILQKDFNNIGTGIIEHEYTGINKPPVESGNRIIKTFGGIGSDGISKQSLFDLHSNQNVVISVDASTQQGQTTFGTATAADAMAQTQNSFVPGMAMASFKGQMWAFLAQSSKELNLETIGLPEIKIGDNIYVNLAGALYSGKYKVIEMSHKIDGSGFFTNLRGIRTYNGLGGASTDEPAIVELPLSPKGYQEATEQKALEGQPAPRQRTTDHYRPLVPETPE